MATLNDLAEKQDFRNFILTAITSSLVFVLGLFWNDAIKTIIESMFPATDIVGMKIMVAIMVTIIIILVVFILYRSMHLADKIKHKIKEDVNEIRKRKLYNQRDANSY